MLCQRTRHKKWLKRRFNEENYIPKDLKTEENMLVPMNGNSVLDDCIIQYPKTRSILSILIANGARLDTVWPAASRYITDEIRDIEYGVLDCRDAVVAFLFAAKRRAFFIGAVREIALAIWATRTDWY
jgi:hypothetical protein